MTNEEAKAFLDNLKILVSEHPVVADWLVEIADRKTEPRKEQCGKCRYLYRDFKYGLSCYRLMDNEPCKYEERKTESNSEKPNNCDTCKHNKLEWYSEVCDGCSKAHSNYEPKDEPTISKMEQVDEPQWDVDKGTTRCDNCSENGSYKCTKCDGEMYFKRLEVGDEPQTERSE